MLSRSQADEEAMARKELEPEKILAILRETPGRLEMLAAGRDREAFHRRPAPGDWSANDVLAHLRACHDTLGGSMLRIVREDHPAWKGLNPRAWMKKTDYPDWEFKAALDVFMEQRRELLGVLEELPPESWERAATARDMVGKEFERTVTWYGTWMASHERSHWKQLEALHTWER